MLPSKIISNPYLFPHLVHFFPPCGFSFGSGMKKTSGIFCSSLSHQFQPSANGILTYIFVSEGPEERVREKMLKSERGWRCTDCSFYGSVNRQTVGYLNPDWNLVA
jgi:hypothetical protein